MKLNPDCVRDILLSIESVTDCTTSWTYKKGECTCNFLSRYSHEEITYHVKQCKYANLITNFTQYDMYTALIVNDLTPTGHQFLANTVSPSVWEKTKHISKKIGCVSLPALMQISTSIMTSLIKAELGII